MTLTANGTAVHAGIPIVLTWSSTNATSCTATGGWSGTKPTSGRELVPVGTTAVTFGLTCQGAGGTASQSVAVSILPPRPVITLTATPSIVAVGSTVNLEWSVDNADSCTASGGWTGARATSGSESSGSLAADTSYTLACTGTGGDATTSITVDTQLPPTVALWFDPATVEVGGLTRATWVARNSDECTATGAWSGARAAEDSVVVGPFAAGASVFTLTCGSAVSSAVVSGTVTATTPVKFVAFDFVEDTAAHSSVVLHPVNGEPTVGEAVALAVFSGPVATIAFRFVDMAGNEMLAPTFAAVAADAPGRKQFQGTLNVPTEPFSVIASGLREDGAAFSVRHERVFRPQTVRVDISGTPLTTDVAAPLAVKVRNLGAAAQVLVRCSAERPVQISPSSTRVQIAADGEETVTVEALAVGPVQAGAVFPKVSCFAVVLDGEATGQNNSGSITLPIEDELGADFE